MISSSDVFRHALPIVLSASMALSSLVLSSCNLDDKSVAGATQGDPSSTAAARRGDPSSNWTIMTKTSLRTGAADRNAAAPDADRPQVAVAPHADAMPVPSDALPQSPRIDTALLADRSRRVGIDAADICRPWPVKAADYNPTDEMKAQALIEAYPDLLDRFEGGYLYWKDGSRMRFNDGIANKSTDDLVNHPDLKDMFRWRYDFCGTGLPVKSGADAGRVRNEEFFIKMYGSCDKRPGEACGNVVCRSKGAMVSVPWVPGMKGGTMLATTVNGVDKKLRAVSDELDKLNPEYKKYLAPNGGSYVPRCIAGTNRLSVHSFGIAFDISPAYGQYWQYGLEKGITEASFELRHKPLTYKNKIPKEIVAVFEKHGFIWGGSWYHFDGMHFEYRPEFLALRNIMERQAAAAGRG